MANKKHSQIHTSDQVTAPADADYALAVLASPTGTPANKSMLFVDLLKMSQYLTAPGVVDTTNDLFVFFDASASGMAVANIATMGVIAKDGSVALTANWDAGSYQIRAETFQSDVATGTAPLTVASTTAVANLNADKVDGTDVNDGGISTNDIWTADKIISYVTSVKDGLDYQVDVLNIQTDATLDPGASPSTSDRYIITDSTALHANFGTISGVGDNDIVSFNGSAFVVAYDVSSEGEGALVYNRNDNLHKQWDGSTWGNLTGAGGETNTASNQGGGTSVYYQKVGPELQFNSVTGGSGIAASLASQLITFSLDALTADWDAGSYKITAETLESDVATGTAPLVVASTTVVTNLNADQLDGNEAAAFGLVAGKLDQFAATTSLELAGVISDETGTGSIVFNTSPTLVTPALGTPASGVLTNCTGTAAGLTAGNVTTNANLTGHVTSVGNAAVLGSFTLAQLNTAVSDATLVDAALVATAIDTSAELLSLITDETGTGSIVFNTSPTLVTPALGTPSALVLTNATGLPVAGLAGGTDGELITWDASGNAATVAVGSSGEVLTSNGAGAAPTFQAAAAGDALTSNGLDQFAATTLAELNGVLSDATLVDAALVATAIDTSAELLSLITDETGTGSIVFNTSPTLVTPALGTPSALVLTNATGLPVAGLAGGTDGELITWDASGNAATVAVGTSGHVLTSNGAGAAPTFQAAAGGSLTNWTEATGTYSTQQYCSFIATNAATNIHAVLGPKGTGAIQTHVADGTSAGGNQRGNYAVDLQTKRITNDEVASGYASVVIGGQDNRASSSTTTVIGGQANVASGSNSACVGGWANEIAGQYTAALGGSKNEATSAAAFGIVHGEYAKATRAGEHAHGSPASSVAGRAQASRFVFFEKTTDGTESEMSLSSGTTRLTIPTDSVLTGTVTVSAIRDDGSEYEGWTAGHFSIRNDSGTVALLGSVGLTQQGATTWLVSVEADDTNNALVIKVTGESAKTIHWSALVDAVQVTI